MASGRSLRARIMARIAKKNDAVRIAAEAHAVEDRRLGQIVVAGDDALDGGFRAAFAAQLDRIFAVRHAIRLGQNGQRSRSLRRSCDRRIGPLKKTAQPRRVAVRRGLGARAAGTSGTRLSAGHSSKKSANGGSVPGCDHCGSSGAGRNLLCRPFRRSPPPWRARENPGRGGPRLESKLLWTTGSV